MARFPATDHGCPVGCRAHGPLLAVGVWLLISLALVIGIPATIDELAATTIAGRTYEVPLDLTQSETYFSLPGPAEMQRTSLREVRLQHGPSSCRLIPADGIVRHGRRLDILLDETLDVRIRVSLVRRGDHVAVRISPLVGVASGNPAAFTADRIQRSAWSLHRQVRDVQRQVAAARREHHSVTTWLETPGNKPLDLYKAARQRQKQLDRQILAGLQKIPPILARCAVTSKLMELARDMHGTAQLRFTLVVTNSASHP